MKHGRFRATAALLCVSIVAVTPACSRRKPQEVYPITPSVTLNRDRIPLGSAVEVTYAWKVEPGAKPLGQDYRVFSHFLDSHNVILFTDDHVPSPAPSAWQPGNTYSYTRTAFVPIYPYVGEAQVVVGLYPVSGRGERVALKGEDVGLRAYKVAKVELLPQTENIFLVYKEGWHNPEVSPQNPGLERTWTKKDALISFKNPKKDIVIYLEADTNYKAFDAPPMLTVSVAGRSGLVIPIENSEVFLKKIRVKGADLGQDEWVDLRLSMNQSFVPKAKGVNAHDDRELGLLVYHLYVADAERLGSVGNVVDAGPLTGPGSTAAVALARAAQPGVGGPAPARTSTRSDAAARPAAPAAPTPKASPIARQ